MEDKNIKERDFDILRHTADLRIRVYGKTKEELFRNALIGMFQSLLPRVKDCSSKGNRLVCDRLPVRRRVSVKSMDANSLLVDFLSEALSLSDIHNEVYLGVKIFKFGEKTIEVELHGASHQGFEESEIKAVTFHELNIEWKDGWWQTNIVFDT